MISNVRKGLLALLSAPYLVVASATSQFHLSTEKDVSKCFLTCHSLTVALLSPKYSDGNEQQLTFWCSNQEYVESIPKCLIQACKSSPDVAYGVEFGHKWCKKAGVRVEDGMVLPESYTMGPAKEYFTSPEYLSAAPLAASPGFAVTVAAVSAATAFGISSIV